MKIKWLIADATTVGPPDSRTYYIRGDFGWACFWPIQVLFVAGEPLCGVLSWYTYKILPGFENPIFGRLLAHACFADFRGIRRQTVSGVIKINYLLFDYFRKIAKLTRIHSFFKDGKKTQPTDFR